MKRLAVFACVLFFQTGIANAQDKTIKLTVTAGKQDYNNVPVCVPLSLPKSLAKDTLAELSGSGHRLFGQVSAPGIRTRHIKPEAKNLVRRDLHFILPSLKAGLSISFDVHISDVPAFRPGRVFLNLFSWKDTKGDYAELSFDDIGKGSRRPILRYMYKAYDDSGPDKRNRTYKIFHHLYDPAGKRFVTNGGHNDIQPGDDEKKLLYPHHRGLQMGFNRITYDNKTADTWHCPGGVHQSHVSFINVEAGWVLGRHRVAVDWHGQKSDVFAKEERELTVYAVPGGTLVEFASRLRTADGPVKLDGDPQHAGFQFRASNLVAEKTAKETYYLRPDGKGELGEIRNWPETKNHVDLPWNAMSFVIDGKRFTAAYLDHPSNPRPSRHSERDYGRFGCYFQYEVTKDHPLVVNYRVWLQDGEMTGPQVQTLSNNFVAAPKVSVK